MFKFYTSLLFVVSLGISHLDISHLDISHLDISHLDISHLTDPLLTIFGVFFIVFLFLATLVTLENDIYFHPFRSTETTCLPGSFTVQFRGTQSHPLGISSIKTLNRTSMMLMRVSVTADVQTI